MNKAFLRGFILLILLASVAVRFQTNRERLAMTADFDVGAAVTSVIRQHGYAMQENQANSSSMLASAIYFRRPECAQSSLVLPHAISDETQTLLARVTKPGSVRHFFYLDGSWPDQDRVAMFLEWAKYAVLDIVGASRYIPVKQAIVLADPPDCHPAAEIDWRPVWERHHPRSAVSGGVPEHLGS